MLPIALIGLGLMVVVGAWVAMARPGRAAGSSDTATTFAVKRGGFDITIPASGELTALRQIEIRNKLETKAVITEIVDEGKTVKAGDVLLRLADEELRNKIKDGEDAVKTALSAKIAAESALAIGLKSQSADLSKADLDVELAKLALQAWREGDDVSKRKELSLKRETAEINHQRLVERYDASKRLVEQEFISTDEFKRDEIEMIEARATLDQARLDIEVYENYTRVQEEKKKVSDVEQAESERDRVKQRHEAELQTLRSDLDSKTYKHNSAQERLTEQQRQFEHCVVTAPTDGLVVYASSLETNGWGRMDGQPLQVGTELRQNDLVMILPDTTQMVAAVKVNEALTGQIQPGQRATITSDAMPNTVIAGEVLSIGVLAETGGWRDPNRRDYTVRVLLHDTNDMGLKPSMRCKADIYVGRVDDALYVPIQSVFRNGPTSFVYVPQSDGYAQKAVSLGRASELSIEVREGLSEGDVVALREPKPAEVVATLPKTPSPDRGPGSRPDNAEGAPKPQGQAAVKNSEGRRQRPSSAGS